MSLEKMQIPSKKPDWQGSVPWICTLLASGGTDSGQLARLRRMKTGEAVPAFWWGLALLEKNKLDRQITRTEISKWIELFRMLAILTPVGNQESNENPESPHQYDIPMGVALFECGNHNSCRAVFSEMRLASLLDSRGKPFTEKLTRACRILAAKNQKLNCEELAQLIFHNRANSPAYDYIRQRIARDYYRRAVRAEEAS